VEGVFEEMYYLVYAVVAVLSIIAVIIYAKKTGKNEPEVFLREFVGVAVGICLLWPVAFALILFIFIFLGIPYFLIEILGARIARWILKEK
jgi:hypothetical protein